MYVQFLNAPLFWRLLPITTVLATIIAIVAEYRSRMAQNSVTDEPSEVSPSFWERRLGRLGRSRWFRGSLATARIVTLPAMALLATVLVAQPVFGNRPHKVAAGKVRIGLLADVSLSLGACDYKDVLPRREDEPYAQPGSRTDMIREVLKRLSGEIEGNEVTICFYASKAQMMLPTFASRNWAPIWFQIEMITPGGVEGGTRSDLANGLAEMVRFFKDHPDPGKQDMILLFTDGGFSPAQQEGKSEDELLADAAKRLREQIAAIKNDPTLSLVICGLGADTEQTIPQYQRNQDNYLVQVGELRIRDAAGNEVPALTRYQPEMLEMIARELGSRCQLTHIKRPEDLQIKWPQLVGAERLEVGKAPATRFFAMLLAALIAIRCLLA